MATSTQVDTQLRKLGYYLAGGRGNWIVKDRYNNTTATTSTVKELRQLLKVLKTKVAGQKLYFDGADWFAY